MKNEIRWQAALRELWLYDAGIRDGARHNRPFDVIVSHDDFQALQDFLRDCIEGKSDGQYGPEAREKMRLACVDSVCWIKGYLTGNREGGKKQAYLERILWDLRDVAQWLSEFDQPL